MSYTRRDALNLLSARQQAVPGKQYVDEYGVVYVGNKKGRLERLQGPTFDYVDQSVQSAKDYTTVLSEESGSSSTTNVTSSTSSSGDNISPFLLMGG